MTQPWGGELADLLGYVAMVFTWLGIWLLARRDTRGWPVAMVGDVVWLAACMDSGHVSFVINDLVIAALHVKGWLYWRKSYAQ